jgi:hypothetical protein
MESSLESPLKAIGRVNKFVIGGPEEGEKGRSKGLKKLIIIAIEILGDGGVGSAYAEVIENSSAKELGSFIMNSVSKDAEITTDKWKGYLPLKKDFLKLKQVASEDGKNFKELHIHIMNIKGWLRGMHHHCSREHMQNHLNEYHFRYNRRSNTGTIFDVLMRKMVEYN